MKLSLMLILVRLPLNYSLANLLYLAPPVPPYGLTDPWLSKPKRDTLTFLRRYLQLSLNSNLILERRRNRLSLNFPRCCSRHVTREKNLLLS